MMEGRENARLLCESYTNKFPFKTCTYSEYKRLREEKCKVYLIDVRSDAEQKVSMIKGAITQHDFEALQLNPAETQDEKIILIPYCTIGHRSGVYCLKLLEKGWETKIEEGKVQLLNGLGVVPFSYDGMELEKCNANVNQDEDGNSAAVSLRSVTVNTMDLHVFGETWNIANSEYNTVTFNTCNGGICVIFSFICSVISAFCCNCNSNSGSNSGSLKPSSSISSSSNN